MTARLTRCPACATVFRVTPEQLASRQGFVRCGQCAKVFDARASLTEETPPAEAPGPAAPDEATRPSPAVETAAPTAASETNDAATAWPFAPAGAGSEARRTDAPGGTSSAPVAPRAAPAPAAAALEDVPSVPPPEPEYSLADVPSAPPAEYEFGPKHRQRSRRASLAWGFGSVLLLAALAAQGAYWFRTELAAALPEVRPYLEAACAPLGCTVPPARQTALITIESSELQVDKNVPGLLTLDATLRNRATFPQQHPSIEVTLTDADERPLSRRVLAPPEYLGDRMQREPLFAAASEYSVRLHIDATAIRPTGYRLFLFHP